jgi:hypothetical protein
MPMITIIRFDFPPETGSDLLSLIFRLLEQVRVHVSASTRRTRPPGLRTPYGDGIMISTLNINPDAPLLSR